MREYTRTHTRNQQRNALLDLAQLQREAGANEARVRADCSEAGESDTHIARVHGALNGCGEPDLTVDCIA